jgi:hypothetical protein
MGRPKGSKNKPGHKAGANQVSQKAKKKTQEKLFFRKLINSMKEKRNCIV